MKAFARRLFDEAHFGDFQMKELKTQIQEAA